MDRKRNISLGINLTGALICAYVVLAAVMPAVLPAIPVVYGTTLIAIGICSSNRFMKLGRECRNESHARFIANLNAQRIKAKSAAAQQAAPQVAPTPSPAPDFNGAAATVLDDDLEINRPLRFKKKAPGASA
ncbi:MAG: hypothetical protein ACAH80_03270 [Alphaproteobacteria bacterium]